MNQEVKSVQQKTKKETTYIRGLDGLRAIAVIAVMVFHIDPLLLPGGFTGVDVFFILSGYVVSASLARSPSVSFTQFITSFYARRILRIYPALIACLITVGIVSTLFIPSPSSWLGNTNHQTALSAFFGVSNFVLIWLGSGYFAPAIEFNPFVHTWTLGVEEQFYVIFPLMMFVWIKYKEKLGLIGIVAKWFVAALLITSLVISIHETLEHPDRAFYLLPSRFWELACGALLFQLHSGRKLIADSAIKERLCLSIGILLVGFGFVFSKTNSFPFPWALLSVSGGLFLISGLISRRPDTRPILRRFLENSTMVYIGKISFSLYLWHWPVYVLYRWTIGLETLFEIGSAVALTVALANISYHYIENPIRRNKFITGRSSWKIVSVGIIVIITSSLLTASVFKAQPVLSLSVTEDRETWYPRSWKTEVSEENEQIFNGRKLFVYGDSHAGAYRTMLRKLSDIDGVEVHTYSKGGCNYTSLLRPHKRECEEFFERILSELKSLASPGDILFLPGLRMNRLGKRWETFNEEDVISSQLSEEGISNRKLALDEATDFLKRFQDTSMHIILEAPKPVFKSPPYRCSDWFNASNPVCGPGFNVKREFLLEHRKPVMNSINLLTGIFPELIVWDPFPVLCKTNLCSAFDQDKPLFYDGDHLSAHGNRILYPSFHSLLKEIWI